VQVGGLGEDGDGEKTGQEAYSAPIAGRWHTSPAQSRDPWKAVPWLRDVAERFSAQDDAPPKWGDHGSVNRIARTLRAGLPRAR
jgi:hypothetical protein